MKLLSLIEIAIISLAALIFHVVNFLIQLTLHNTLLINMISTT